MPRPGGWFVVAAVLAAAAAVLTLRAAARVPTEPILVAATELPAGARLDGEPAPVRIEMVPRGGRRPGMLAGPGEVGGRRLVVPVGEGEPVTEAGLGGPPLGGGRPLEPHERAVSVPRAAAGAAAVVLVPGMLVDVVGAPLDGGTQADLVVAAAEVIVQTGPVDTGDVAGGDGAILLRVGARDALRLSAALDRGAGVRLLPRPFDGVDPEPGP
jgi:Flp pilus assembly protein CpaB